MQHGLHFINKTCILVARASNFSGYATVASYIAIYLGIIIKLSDNFVCVLTLSSNEDFITYKCIVACCG